ncbi:hypothetical protein NDU88_003602 [Pleurodeles waltl]|uniref:Uncharacterized protein n=1 Tax=Pleurodeles waltl TaxID=8319 RepID=A0AAV7L4C0_PLEWA|nr:hypothetical protein NDU88_003602 [Pleurodeles waltl]
MQQNATPPSRPQSLIARAVSTRWSPSVTSEAPEMSGRGRDLCLASCQANTGAGWGSRQLPLVSMPDRSFRPYSGRRADMKDPSSRCKLGAQQLTVLC